MRDHGPPQATIALLAEAERRFTGREAFMVHLETLGLTGLKVHPDPVQIASEGAAWGSIAEQRLMDETVIPDRGPGPLTALASSTSPRTRYAGFTRNG